MKTLPVLIAAVSSLPLGQVKTNVPDTRDVVVRFQEHVMPFFGRLLWFQPVKR